MNDWWQLLSVYVNIMMTLCARHYEPWLLSTSAVPLKLAR
jgi:hypothetical protein